MSRRSKARRSADAALAALYASLPTLECQGLCHEVCGAIGFTRLEQIRMEEAHGGPLPLHMPAADCIQAVSCPLLQANRCSIYAARPLLCRAWGLIDDDLMRCPHGCRPSRYLTPEEGRIVFRKIALISKRFEEEEANADR